MNVSIVKVASRRELRTLGSFNLRFCTIHDGWIEGSKGIKQ